MENVETSMAEALASAHIALLRDLRELELAGHTASKHHLPALRARLEATRAHIAEHFRFEEEDGYMAIIREREPRLEQAIGELATEHRQLLSALDALLVESASTPVLDEVMCARVCQWINHVRQHEAREDHLVQDAFDLDIRTED